LVDEEMNHYRENIKLKMQDKGKGITKNRGRF
jgi:hypothetical protein